ncbi:MAG: thrombospondin type 3 repeat-containing protein, partial [Desulfobacteraceae bacterium]|nr:thrombospondin type 3 repeat-containing protein [Desulfobacteraceae bacterium]
EDNDADDDGILDDDDNCPNDANPGQEDVDDDGIGDVCEVSPAAGRSSLSDIFGDGTCTLNAGASAGSHLGILSLLFAFSAVAIRRRFR